MEEGLGFKWVISFCQLPEVPVPHRDQTSSVQCVMRIASSGTKRPEHEALPFKSSAWSNVSTLPYVFHRAAQNSARGQPDLTVLSSVLDMADEK